MANQTSGTIYLQDAAPGEKRWAKIAPIGRGTAIPVRRVTYETGLLGKVIRYVQGDSPVVAGLQFDGPRGWTLLHYHPGAATLGVRATWDLVRVLLAIGQFAEIASRPEAGRPRPQQPPVIPQDVKDGFAAVNIGFAPSRALRGFHELQDADLYPREGYYESDAAAGMLVVGKIRAINIGR